MIHLQPMIHAIKNTILTVGVYFGFLIACAFQGAVVAHAHALLPVCMVEQTTKESVIFPAVRKLQKADFQNGFILTQIHTNEVFDFSPPPGATIHEPWLKSGTFQDSFRLVFGEEWHFPFGGTNFSAITIGNDGTFRERMKSGMTIFKPLQCALQIVPSAQKLRFPKRNKISQFWSGFSPSNTFLVTAQNVLLKGQVTHPVSFQTELFDSGKFIFRYDLSRLKAHEITNVLVGVSSCVGGQQFSALRSNITSLHWMPLSLQDFDSPDWDEDGLSLNDELFVYHTDPHKADTDGDGLSDGEEVHVYHTNPCDAHSLGSDFCDGIAAKLGNLNPFSHPPHSTNTVLEHLVYTGSTSEPFLMPKADKDYVVIHVKGQGKGIGDLVIDGVRYPVVGDEWAPQSTPVKEDEAAFSLRWIKSTTLFMQKMIRLILKSPASLWNAF